jgi:hypothetical protein
MPNPIQEEPIVETLILKVPFFIVGVLVGMAIVWIALQWVPGAAQQALNNIGAG